MVGSLRPTSIRCPSKEVKIIPCPLSSVTSGALCLHGPSSLPESEYASVSAYTSSFQLDQIINNFPVLVLYKNGPSVTYLRGRLETMNWSFNHGASEALNR